MGRYVLLRTGMAFVVIILSVLFLSVLVHLVPGDPVKIILGPRASESLSRLAREEMGLDDPVMTQVLDFVTGAVRGDLGEDFVSRLPVAPLVIEAALHTFVLAAAGLGLAVVIGVPLGVVSAAHPNGWIDRSIAVLSVALITIPTFVAGLYLLLIFSVQLSVFPSIGAGELSDPRDYLRHLTLPAIALAVAWTGYLARLVRTSMLEVMSSNYTRTARAFGLPERWVLYRYSLRNAIVPTVAVLGVGLGNLIAGAVFVEVIFSRPGLGSLVVDAISTRNFPIVRGAVLVIVVLVVVANLLADLSYRFLDPRTRSATIGAAA